jgi:hypothetical protein
MELLSSLEESLKVFESEMALHGQLSQSIIHVNNNKQFNFVMKVNVKDNKK